MATILLYDLKSDFAHYFKGLLCNGSCREVKQLTYSILKKVEMYKRRADRAVARRKLRGLLIKRLLPCIQMETEKDLILFLKMFHQRLEKKNGEGTEKLFLKMAHKSLKHKGFVKLGDCKKREGEVDVKDGMNIPYGLTWDEEYGVIDDPFDKPTPKNAIRRYGEHTQCTLTVGPPQEATRSSADETVRMLD